MALVYGDLNTVTLVTEMGTPTGKTDPAPSTGSVVIDWPDDLLSISSPGGNRIFTPAPITATIDSLGQLKNIDDELGLVLPVTDDPDVTPTGWTYHVTHKISNDGGRPDRDYYITISHLFATAYGGSGIVNLADLVPVQPLTGFDEFVTLAEFNDVRDRLAVLEAIGFGVAGERMFTKNGTLALSTGTERYYSRYDQYIDNVLGSVGIPGTGGGSVVYDVKMNDTTIFTTGANRPTIAAGAHEDLISVPDVVFFPKDSYLTADIVDICDGFAGGNGAIQIDSHPA